MRLFPDFRVRRLLSGGFLLLLLLGLCAGCRDDAGPTTPVGAGAMTGRVVGTLAGQPLAGVTVAIGMQRATTDAEGRFTVSTGGAGARLVQLSGDPVYARAAVVKVAAAADPVELDAIERGSGFDLAFYRELARGNHPTERQMLPIQRWTAATAPQFYIDTNADAVYDGDISQATIEAAAAMIRQVLPVFSGGRYQSASIATREFTRHSFDELAEPAIVISFDDTLSLQEAVGLAVTEPDCTKTPAEAIQKAWIFVLDQEMLYQMSGLTLEENLAHELGHAFGYRHTSALPSIMRKHGVYGGLFSEHDRLHMAVVYQRPVGNTDPDNDPLPGGKMFAGAARRKVFLDTRPGLAPRPEVTRRLQQLPRLTGSFLPRGPG